MLGLWNADKQAFADRLHAQEKRHQDQIASVTKAHYEQLTGLNRDIEQLRMTKDAEIKTLITKIESQRVEYEITINAHLEVIKQLKNKILQQDAEILALNTILIRKNDVEEQLRIAREHEA